MSNPMTSLVLDEGMSVELRGQLALCEDEVVLTGCGVLPFGSPPHLTWEQTPFVALATDCAKKARPLVGQPVFGRATWTGYEISACELEPGDAWAHAHDIPGPLTKDRTPVSAHVRSVEAGLFSSGAMLRRVRHGRRRNSKLRCSSHGIIYACGRPWSMYPAMQRHS